MRQPATRELVTLALPLEPALDVDFPQQGVHYKAGGRSITLGLDQLNEYRKLTIMGPHRYWTFGKGGQISHVVEVAGRYFRITLEGVRDRSTLSLATGKPMAFLEYAFSVVEQLPPH